MIQLTLNLTLVPSWKMSIALITSLVLIEPLSLLAISTATFTQKRVRRAWAFPASRDTKRFSKRDFQGETAISALPEEILVEIVKLLEWRDILRIRQASKRLHAISKSLTVWRCVVERVPPGILWLERPIQTYAAEELERLSLRRQRAEVGYEAIANGAMPCWRTMEVDEPPERPTMHIVPGGRWLLVPNSRGSVLYYDLDAHDVRVRVLIPEKYAKCLTKMSIDVDSSSPYLRFNLALNFHFLRKSDYRIEVWQVDLILDEHGQGMGLTAACQASFNQEPPGLCDSLSLLSDNLAFTAFYEAHLERYTVIINWKSVKGPDYLKKLFYPSSGCCARLLPGNLLVSASYGDIIMMSIASLPVITTIPDSGWQIPQVDPFVFLSDVDEASLSGPTLHEGLIRFVVTASNAVYGLSLIPSPTRGGDKYQVKTDELLKFSKPPYHMPLSLHEDFLVVWSQDCGLIMHRISWSNPTAKGIPLGRADLAAPFEWKPSCSHQLDMTSGRFLIQRCQRIMVLDLSL